MFFFLAFFFACGFLLRVPDELLFRGDVLYFGELCFEVGEDGQGGRYVAEFKEDLERQEKTFGLQELFDRVHVLHDLVEVGEGAAVLLGLVAEYGDVVEEGEVAVG